MTGNEIYEKKYMDKIEKILVNNPDKKYLRGFYNYMNELSYSTIYDYINYVVNFIDYAKLNVEELTLDDYTEYLATLRNTTSSYQISVYSGLKKFSIYLKAANRNILNPMQYVSRPKFKEGTTTKEKREIGFLETREIKKYINTVKTGAGSSRAIARQEAWKERDLLIIQMLLNTGMRCSALFKLNVENIDFSEKTLVTIDKGEKFQKYDLSDELLNLIIQWLEKRENILNGSNEDALFISNQKTRMDQASIYRIVNKYSKNIEGKHITPHKLRATYGTHLYDKTKDVYLVQSCMGHSNPKTTEMYIRGQGNNSRKIAADVMSRITLK